MTLMNLTQIQGNATMGNFVCMTNTASNGMMLGAFMIAIFFVLLLVLKKYPFEKGLLVASWSSFLLSSILATANCAGVPVLSPFYALAFLIVAGLTSLYVWTQES